MQWLFSPIVTVVMSATITGDEATHSHTFTQTLIYSHDEFSKLKDKSWQTLTYFEQDLEVFELKTSTNWTRVI